MVTCIIRGLSSHLHTHSRLLKLAALPKLFQTACISVPQITMNTKPPNVLIYSNIASIQKELVSSLRMVLAANEYTIYPVTELQVKTKAWPESTVLFLVHGIIEKDLAEEFLDFFLHGGKLMSVCSNLQSFVRPCYQSVTSLVCETINLPCEKLEEFGILRNASKGYATTRDERLTTQDAVGSTFGTQMDDFFWNQTNNSSSIVSLTELKSGGRVVFSQVTFTESSCSLGSEEERKSKLNFYSDLLKSQFGIKISLAIPSDPLTHVNGFFLGNSQRKVDFLTNFDNPIKSGDISLQFCTERNDCLKPSLTMQPVLVHDSPEDFDAVEYYNHLKSTHVGQLVIYLPVASSSMTIISNAELCHGFVVIPRQQTNGKGRSKNQWLSPKGCAMFSLQMHVPLDSPLGQRLPLIQHLVAVGVVKAIRSMAGCNELDIRLKWPNDIYANRVTKIGGLIINSRLQSDQAIVNIGCGLNVNNSSPTICIDDLIKKFNVQNSTNYSCLKIEQTLALVFNEIEQIFDAIQCGEADIQHLYDLYYENWLHQDATVTVKTAKGSETTGVVTGIDEYGYLMVKTDNCTEPFSVHPDGNSFDMMKGLIIPKQF